MPVRSGVVLRTHARHTKSFLYTQMHAYIQAWVKEAPEHSGFPEYKIKLKNNSGIAILSCGISEFIGKKKICVLPEHNVLRVMNIEGSPTGRCFLLAAVVPGRNTSRLLRMRTLN